MHQVTTALTPDQIKIIEAKEAVGAVSEKPSAPPPPVTPSPNAPPRFVNAGARQRVVQLDYPLEYGGVVYEAITARRPDIEEWEAYIDACREARLSHGDGAERNVDQPWVSAPAIVLRHLDLADHNKLEAVLDSFFGQPSPPPEAGTAGQ